ncbi:hypothetical protein E2562_037747 [Oryza meyeriana var. granulata]|uniref:Uncharacterized protein n=1 Tax=Oryza meyeriana var. granulata TaxID=110450 RepID=A0A6G1FGN2_9ORYZ|nr:hypothetical protein E2562_037747 [Oryza meyeriana var. granulata]
MDDLAAALARGEGAWTEKQHAAFLDRIELSFVQQELGAVVVSDERRASRRLCRRTAPPPPPPPVGGRGGQLQLPLDRPLPDSAVESNRASPSSRPASRGGGAK